ncbi:MAG: radical SAM protein [Desulfurococcales archaeon]|nr:radical SAM protein [Desulfurococcales archaeon]
MRLRRVIILDGYNDEPGGLGVPPYIDVYPRYVAGALWSADKSIRVDYLTIDQFRASPWTWISRMRTYDLVVIIAGVVVPGKYLGGNPAEPREVLEILRALREHTYTALVGPAASWGLGWEGGKPAVSPAAFRKAGADFLVTGDLDVFFMELATDGPEKARPWARRESYEELTRPAILGSRIIRQHPNYGANLIVELETYRGCARWVSGGCSFCVEPLRGRPTARSPDSIVAEVEALYRWGARNFRLGRQADILVYGSPGLGREEWPKPSPSGLRRVFQGIRSAAPGLETLHIDNVNPGTVARHPVESREALKVIVEYHTPGDVAALGLETADPKVARLNNLNTTPEEALEAIRIINSVGSIRGGNGLPHLLPGLNFILGLPGERAETYRLNREFLETLLRENLLVRRVNVRRLMPIPMTRAYRMKHGVRGRLEKHAKSFTYYVRHVFDREMLRRVVPRGTVLRGLWVEQCQGNICYARQPGSYPVTVAIKGSRLARRTYLGAVRVVGLHSGRSVLAEPVSTANVW